MTEAMYQKLLLAGVPDLAAGPAMARSAGTVYGAVDAGLVRESGGMVDGVTKLTSGVESGARIGLYRDRTAGRRPVAKSRWKWACCPIGRVGPDGRSVGRQPWVASAADAARSHRPPQCTPLFPALNTIAPVSGISSAGTAASPISLDAIRMNNTVKHA
jgi:hypothetical protein